MTELGFIGLAVAVVLTAALVWWAVWSTGRIGMGRTASKVMLIGLGTLLVAIPSCAGCMVATVATWNPTAGNIWLLVWWYVIGVALITMLIGAVLKFAGADTGSTPTSTPIGPQ